MQTRFTYHYFRPDMTRDQIRDEYRRLAKRLHPDLGGNTADMQALNAEYDAAMDAATRAEMPGRTDASYTHQAATNQRIREAIAAALKFEFLTVELCGWWVWIHGTQPRGSNPANDAAIDALRAAGFQWAKGKQQWYFAGIPSNNRKEQDMDEIRQRHGSEFVRRDKAKRQRDEWQRNDPDQLS